MENIALHLLDIIQNSIDAEANRISIEIEKDILKNSLCITITDNGKGILLHNMSQVYNPFYTSRTTRKVGIGLSLLKQHVELTKGFIHVLSEENVGTKINFSFNLWHIDCPPLGNFADVISTVVAVNPTIEFFCCFRSGARVFTFESKMILDIFKGIDITQSDIKHLLFRFLSENIDWFYHSENNIINNEEYDKN